MIFGSRAVRHVRHQLGSTSGLGSPPTHTHTCHNVPSGPSNVDCLGPLGTSPSQGLLISTVVKVVGSYGLTSGRLSCSFLESACEALTPKCTSPDHRNPNHTLGPKPKLPKPLKALRHCEVFNSALTELWSRAPLRQRDACAHQRRHRRRGLAAAVGRPQQRDYALQISAGGRLFVCRGTAARL